MKLIIFSLVCGCLQTIYAQESLTAMQKARFTVAQEWLENIGVKFDGRLERAEDFSKLTVALDQWISENILPQTNEGPKLSSADGLVPSIPDRFTRLPTFKVDRVGSPRNVLATPEGGGAALIQPNPDRRLLSYTFTFNLAELYVGVSERVNLCKAAMDIVSSTEFNNKLKCDKSNYLSSSRTADTLGRIASASTFSFSASEIPRVQNGVLLSPNSPLLNRSFNKSFNASFEPSLLFRSSSEWNAFAGYYSEHNLPDEKIPKYCDNNITACTTNLKGTAVWRKVLLAAAPKFELKSFTPFDFIKTSGGAFVEPPGARKPIYEFIYTWDYRRITASASARIDALNAAKAFLKKKSSSLAEWKRSVRADYCLLMSTPDKANDNNWWNAFSANVLRQNLPVNTLPKSLVAHSQP